MTEESFKSHVDKIWEALWNRKTRASKEKDRPDLNEFKKKYQMVDGYLNFYIQQEIKSYQMGGPSVPMVCLVEKKTLKAEFYPVLALIPNLQSEDKKDIENE